MDEKEKKSLGVYLIALVIILSNLFVLSVIYRAPYLAQFPKIQKLLPYVSMAAVYPYDIFQIYLKDVLIVHFFWILSVMLAGLGLLVFNPITCTVLLIFIALHVVVLSVITILNVGQAVFWDYFFKWYFNLVAFLVYAGYLTLPEIRVQFSYKSEKWPDTSWFLKVRKKTLGPQDAQGYFNLGLAYYRLARLDEAIEFLQRAVKLVPQKAEYHYHIGKIFLEINHPQDAILPLKEVIRLDPLHSQARYELGKAYEKVGCVEEAVQCLRRVTFLEPNRFEAFRDLGILCFKKGYWDEAEQALRKAVDLESNDYLSQYYLGMVLMKEESVRGQADDFLKRAIRLNPQFLPGFEELGNLYVQRGEYKNAVRMFHDVIRLNPDQKQAHYQLGFAYVMLKDWDSARREYNFLKDVDPDLANNLGMLIQRR